MQGFAGSLAVYFERRMARILLLGIISGFPWVLIGSSLTLWLKEDGLSRGTIGWAGLIFGVYAFNFLWAPLIDRVRLPWLSARIGHRRAWIVTLQAVILICLVLWSVLEPTASLDGVVAVGLVIAIASATQDITIDAFRIEQVGRAEGEAMAAGAATAVVGWWTGFKLGGIVALEVAEGVSESGRRGLLAGNLPRARGRGHPLQHRTRIRSRVGRNGTDGSPGRGGEPDRLPPRSIRAARAGCLLGSGPPSSVR